MAQRVLVTAGASGIGKEIARAFAATSAKVCVCDIDTKALETAAKDIPGLLTKVCDVSNRQDIERMMVDAVAGLGGLDVLVNNAGISGPTAPVESMDPDAWEMVMKVDLTGTFNVTRVAIPHLKKSAAGVIINMSSVAGRFGYANRSPYSTAKWGLIGFTKTLSIELGAVRHPGQCNFARCGRRPAYRESVRGTRAGDPSADRGYQEAGDGRAVDKTAGRSEGHRRACRLPCVGCREIDLGTDDADRQRHAVRVLTRNRRLLNQGIFNRKPEALHAAQSRRRRRKHPQGFDQQEARQSARQARTFRLRIRFPRSRGLAGVQPGSRPEPATAGRTRQGTNRRGRRHSVRHPRAQQVASNCAEERARLGVAPLRQQSVGRQTRRHRGSFAWRSRHRSRSGPSPERPGLSRCSHARAA